MKKLISIVITLALVLSLCAVATTGAGAAKIDVAQTLTPQFYISDEPYQEITPINGFVYGYLGDADLDDAVSVMDATAIQQDCASLSSLDENAYVLADVDLDDSVSVMDATQIQQFMASMATNEYISHTVYEDDLICYTFDQMAEYLIEYGSYTSVNEHYYIDFELPDYNCYLFMAYYPESQSIDFLTSFYEAESNATVSTLMMVTRNNPVFDYSCVMQDSDFDYLEYFESYGTAELMDLDTLSFAIENEGFTSQFTDDFSEFEDVVSSQFILTIAIADEMLWEYIDGYVSDIFW